MIKPIDVRFSRTVYIRTKKTVWVRRNEITNENRLPDKITITETYRDDLRRNGATHVLEGNGILTGIVPMEDGRYFGNHHFDGKRSLTGIRFNAGFDELEVFYFKNFYKQNRAERVKFLLNFFNTY
jgi:hypothetical protein